jgi:hypothetical protein
MRRINIFAVMLLFAISFLANDSFAQRQGNRNFRGQQGGFWTQLNEEQKQELQEKIKGLRDAGASKEEVQEAISSLLESYGIDQSQAGRSRGRIGRSGQGPLTGFMKDLDESQKQAVQDKHKEMREAGKTPEEIHSEIGILLQNFGVELPDNWEEFQGKGRRGRGMRSGFSADLTEDQRKQIQDKQKELREAGKTPEEVHAETGALLQSFGVELPDNWEEFQGKGRRGRGMRGGFSADLTEDQRTQIQDKQKELREAGKTPEEVHSEIGILLQSFGVELPDNWEEFQGKGRRGRGSRTMGDRRGSGLRGGFSAELSEDQKEAIQTKMKELREQKVSREEVHAEIGVLLQSFGVELPDNWEDGPQFRRGRGHRGGFWKQLNDTQKEELQEMIKSLKDNGATKKEIREAVNAKLKELGIEPPQRKRGGQKNQQEAELEEIETELQELEANNYPNPFNPETSIVYTLKNQEKVFIRIFNATGQLVRTLLNADQASGTHSVLWNGRNDGGAMAPSGMYFYRIDAGANSLTQGMILMK